MKILFTGGSSFTGYWFIKELASAGHEVVAIFRQPLDAYPDELRRKRIVALAPICHSVFGTHFGDDHFLELIKESKWDLLCHHGAEVKNYNNSSFDVTAAVASNTHRLPVVLDGLMNAGCNRIIVTGSVFENDEGAGSAELRAFSPYGLSKNATWQMFKYYVQDRSMALGKFVIPNPFGPYEEQRFTHYLMKHWFAGAKPAVNTPSYIRDNIHVSLLAKAYAYFAANLVGGVIRTNPSGYVESQGAFAQRVAHEMRQRLDLKCELEIKTQTVFREPRVRINTDEPDVKILNWDESIAWDEMANYYSMLMARC